jgi:hypothetical protein
VRLAEKQKMQQILRRDMAGHRVQAYEAHLKTSRQEFLEANRGVQEVEVYFSSLQDMLMRAVPDLALQAGQTMTGRSCHEPEVACTGINLDDGAAESDTLSMDSLSSSMG